MNKKISLNSCSPEELKDIVLSSGEKPYRAGQIYHWLHSEKVVTFEEMTNLSKAFKALLADMTQITVLKEISRKVSKRDGSIKFLFELPDKERIESVLLKDGDRVTACISTQVGCKMGCRFCATARIGFRRNLYTAEITEQVRLMEKVALEEHLTPEGRLTNIVFMGMGEPFDNMENVLKAFDILMSENGYGYSHRRLTVSTVGIIPKIVQLFSLDTQVNLAVSINASNQKTRKSIMPISAKYSLEELMKELDRLHVDKRKRITLEYVLLGGLNDSVRDAQEFLRHIKGMPIKVNLIRYNGGGDEDLKIPEEKDVTAFQQVLTDNDISAFVRKSLGADIFGACGQLAAEYK